MPELAARLRPAALAAYDEALKAVFAAGGEQRRRRREALGRAVEDGWQRLQLHSHGTQVQGYGNPNPNPNCSPSTNAET